MGSIKLILFATIIVAQIVSLTQGQGEGPSTEKPPSEQEQIDALRKQIGTIQTEVDWLKYQLAIPGLVWFLFIMFWVLLFAVIFIFYALRCRGRGLPGSNFFS